MKNIELKISLSNFKKIIHNLQQIGAHHQGKIHQVDTYFRCAQGRLKLREIDYRVFELIFYKRPDIKSGKVSNYQIININNSEIKVIKQNLKDAFGELVVVEKDRNLWISKHTRIHLDCVNNLGNFLELETVIDKINFTEAAKEYHELFDLLKLKKYKQYSQSYSDLIYQKINHGSKIIPSTPLADIPYSLSFLNLDI